MRYADGDLIQAGNEIVIDGNIAAVRGFDELINLSAEHESWAYLEHEIVVKTDFAGLVHYTAEATDHLELKSRPSS